MNFKLRTANKHKWIIGVCIVVSTFLMLTSCTTSNHGTFVTSSFIGQPNQIENIAIGKVTGESKQVWALYIFPMGDSPSTNEAVEDAKSKITGTKYLADISIDDRKYWKFGYSEHVISVEATAYK